MEKLSIIIPAFNEEKTIEETIKAVKKVLKKIKASTEVIVVNDGSTDKTEEILGKQKGIIHVAHPYNKGYGASLKTGINKAEGDFVLFIDADGQQNPEDILFLTKETDNYDMVVGARGNHNSFWRAFAKKILVLFANYIADFKIPDLNSGFRLIKKDIVKQYFTILPNAFSFSSTITLALIKDGYNIKYVKIQERKRMHGKSGIHPIKDTIRFFMLIIRLSALFNPLKVFLPISCALFIVGLGALIYDLTNVNITDSTILLLMSGLLIFFFGLLADQISAIRRQIK